MKLKIFFMVVICTCFVLPSVRAINTKKINQKGVYQPYYGYTIVAKIDNRWSQVAKQIEQFIRTSKLKKTYAALPASTYHMSIYTIYSVGNKLIPPVKQWVDKKGNKIPKRGLLPNQVLENQNNEATCVLLRFLYQPLYIKRANLKIGDNIISLTLELDERSLNNIRFARNQLAKVYKHPNLSLEPINKKLHITLAYIYGKKKESYTAEWNKLNELVRLFNGAPLSLPSVYLYESMTKYYQYQSKNYVDCRAYDFWH